MKNLDINVRDIVPDAESDLSGKTGEAVVVQLSDEPPVTLLASELINFLRFERRKADKRSEARPSKPNPAA